MEQVRRACQRAIEDAALENRFVAVHQAPHVIIRTRHVGPRLQVPVVYIHEMPWGRGRGAERGETRLVMQRAARVEWIGDGHPRPYAAGEAGIRRLEGTLGSWFRKYKEARRG